MKLKELKDGEAYAHVKPAGWQREAVVTRVVYRADGVPTTSSAAKFSNEVGQLVQLPLSQIAYTWAEELERQRLLRLTARKERVVQTAVRRADEAKLDYLNLMRSPAFGCKLHPLATYSGKPVLEVEPGLVSLLVQEGAARHQKMQVLITYTPDLEHFRAQAEVEIPKED